MPLVRVVVLSAWDETGSPDVDISVLSEQQVEDVLVGYDRDAHPSAADSTGSQNQWEHVKDHHALQNSGLGNVCSGTSPSSVSGLCKHAITIHGGGAIVPIDHCTEQTEEDAALKSLDGDHIDVVEMPSLSRVDISDPHVEQGEFSDADNDFGSSSGAPGAASAAGTLTSVVVTARGTSRSWTKMVAEKIEVNDHTLDHGSDSIAKEDCHSCIVCIQAHDLLFLFFSELGGLLIDSDGPGGLSGGLPQSKKRSPQSSLLLSM